MTKLRSYYGVFVLLVTNGYFGNCMVIHFLYCFFLNMVKVKNVAIYLNNKTYLLHLYTIQIFAIIEYNYNILY